MVTDENNTGTPGGNGSEPPVNPNQQPQQGAYTPQGGAYQPQQGYTPPAAYTPQNAAYTPQGDNAQTQSYDPNAQTQSYAAQGAYGQQADYSGGQQPPQGTYPAGAYPAGGAPAKPSNKKKIILISAIAGGVVVLLIVGMIIVNVINGSKYSPAAVAEQYLQTIAAGKASEANKMVSPGVKDGEAALLTDDVLKNSSGLMKNPKVTRTSRSGDSAQVTISYSIDGTTYDGYLTLSNQGKQGVFFDDWKIDSPLVVDLYVSGTVAGAAVSVNGVDVDFGDEGTLKAYPGTYTFASASDGFFSVDEVDYVVATGTKASYDYPELNMQPSDTLVSAVQDQLDAFLDECAEATTEADSDDSCDMTTTYYDVAEVTKFEREIIEYPTVELDNYGTFTTTGGEYQFTLSGTDYYGESFENVKAQDTYEPWSYYGTYTIEDGAVTISFDY